MPSFLERTFLPIFLVFAFLMGPGCAVFRKVGLNYSEAKLPDSQIVKNVNYWNSPNADPVKNRLDLFLPTGKNWPIFVFVHGGEWISGDKSLKVMGADIYGNIGRFFAANGIGVAVISYRLMPETNWKSQIMDVARAIYWVHQHIKDYQGNPRELFIGGHSSGAQLAVRVALDPAPLHTLSSSNNIICGVIPISGAGYDLKDDATYEMAKKDDLFLKLFHTDDISNKLRGQLSPQQFVNSKAPPFLILYAADEEKGMQDGSVTLNNRLVASGIESQLFEIPHKGHKTIVLSLSQSKQIPTATMLVFMKSLHCS